MTYLPTFQPQNPALSGDPYGWLGCATYCGAMAADYMSAGKVKITGKQVRAASNEPIPDKRSPGLNLAQVNDAVVRLGGGPFSVHTNTTTKLSWQQVHDFLAAGHGVHIAGGYVPIRASRFAGSRLFGGNHGIFVAPGWIAFDPLADGRQGLYHYHGEAYPESLLRDFAGALNLAKSGYSALGRGWAFANVTAIPIPTIQVPQEADVKLSAVKGEDWTPAQTRRPYRRSPIRGLAPAGYIELGETVRTIAEADTPDGNRWRLTEKGGSPAWLLRSDFTPLVPGGDPAVDQKLTDYIARKP